MKKNHKILLSLILSGTFLMSTIAGNPAISTETSAAVSHHNSYTTTMNLYQDGAVFSTYDTAAVSSETAHTASILSVSAKDTIYNGLLNAQSTIDVSAYKLSFDETKELMQNIINSSPELFYVSNAYSYNYTDTTVTTISPKYNSTGSTLQSQKDLYYKNLNEIVSQVNTTWSPLEKIVFVHDYLCQNYEYDTSYSIYNTYDFFAQKKGVCQAYTLTFIAVMNELGIETSVASSDSMQHIWNLVKLNGKWYHVDVTWDDPVADKYGLAYHGNLLLSDTAIAGNRNNSSQIHSDWISSYTCSSTTYDSYFWGTVTSPFQYLKGQWYYAYYDATIDSAKLNTYNFKSNTSKSITDLGQWTVGDNGYYTSCFSGLDVYNDKLYYNTGKELFYYNPATKTSTTVLTPNKSGNIYGMRINGQVLSYRVASAPDVNGTIYTYTLEAPLATSTPVPVQTATPTPGTTSSPSTTTEPNVPPTSKPGDTPSGYNLGDIDADNNVTLSDAQAALKAALKIIPLANTQTLAADVDRNSQITLADAQLILKYALKIINTF